MAFTVREVVREIYEMLGKPSQSALPFQSVLTVVQQVTDELALDHRLSDKNWFLRAASINPTDQDSLLQITDLGAPVRVESRNAGASPDEIPQDTHIINFDEWNEAVRSGRDVVAFYGTPARVVFSRDVTDREFTVWYEPDMQVAKDLNAEPELANVFKTYIVLKATLQLAAIVQRSDSDWLTQRDLLIKVMAARVVDWETRIRKAINQSRSQGNVSKQPFGRGRYRRGGYQYAGGRIRFLG